MKSRDLEYGKTLKKGETLFGEGEEGDEMYLIKKVKIRIIKEVEEREKLILF